MPRSLFLSTAVLSLLAGCAAVPDLGPKPLPAAAGTFESRQSLADAAGEWPVEGWWQAWGDAQLDALIAEGLANAPDVAIAAARART
ncbi:MAG: multidrug transporter, partial [Sphingopyxis sp.]